MLARFKGKLYTVTEKSNKTLICTPVNVEDVTPYTERKNTFVEIWLSSSNIGEVATASGKSKHQATAYANYLRKLGYTLPRFNDTKDKTYKHIG